MNVVPQRLLESGLKLLDNVYADHVTLALHRAVEPKIFGAKDIWQNNNFGLTRDGVALLVVLSAAVAVSAWGRPFSLRPVSAFFW